MPYVITVVCIIAKYTFTLRLWGVESAVHFRKAATSHLTLHTHINRHTMSSFNASARQHKGTGDASMNTNSTGLRHKIRMAFEGVVSEAHMNQANKRKLAEVETMTLWVVMEPECDLALNVKATDSICTMRTKMQEVIAAKNNDSSVPGIAIAQLYSRPKDCSHCPCVEQCHCCPYLTEELMVVLKDGCSVSDYNLKDGDKITMCGDIGLITKLLLKKNVMRTQKEEERVTGSACRRELIWAYALPCVHTVEKRIGQKDAVDEKVEVDEKEATSMHDQQAMLIRSRRLRMKKLDDFDDDDHETMRLAHDKNAVDQKEQVGDETVLDAPRNMPCSSADARAGIGPVPARASTQATSTYRTRVNQSAMKGTGVYEVELSTSDSERDYGLTRKG
jgi:hypothetical protein